MTYTAPDPRPLYNAIIARLVAQTGRPIGDAEAPDPASLPYAVVYPMIDELPHPSVSDPLQTVDDAFQVTCVGSNRESAQVMQRLVRAALLGWTPSIEDRSTYPIQPLSMSGVERDDNAQPPVFFSTDRFFARISG